MSFIFRYRNYAKAIYQSLINDAFYMAMENSVGNGQSSQEAMLRYMEYSMTEAEKYGELYLPGEHEYGVSIWSKPLNKNLEALKSKEKKIFLLNYMGELSLKKYNAIVDFMATQSNPLIGNEFWYLSIVGILPEFQSQGLGRDLVTKILKKTDLKNVSTYLETFVPRNMSFYNRLGFKAVESFHEPITDADYWLMIREPYSEQV